MSRSFGQMTEDSKIKAEQVQTRAMSLVDRLISQVKKSFTAMQDKGSELTGDLVAQLSGAPQQPSIQYNAMMGRPTGTADQSGQGSSSYVPGESMYLPVDKLIDVPKLMYLKPNEVANYNNRIDMQQVTIDKQQDYIDKLMEDERTRLIQRNEYLIEQRDKYVEELINKK